MNMDVVCEQLEIFHKSLLQFHESVESAWQNMELRHNGLDPMWHDEYQRRYMVIWEPLRDQMNAYRLTSIPIHIDLLEQKIVIARDYMYGDI